jgi:hypothetical protein
MKIKSELRLHNLKTSEILGPFETEAEVCQHIEDLSLTPQDYHVIQQEVHSEMLNFDSTYKAWKYKKSQKKKDIETEPMPEKKLKVIKGEVK